MHPLRLAIIGPLFALGVAACGGTTESTNGGTGVATIAGKDFQLSKLTLSFATGENAYFRIEGDDAANPDRDCLPGLGGGIALYGDLPADVTVAPQLVGRDLPIEFTGDGDDFKPLRYAGDAKFKGVRSSFPVSGFSTIHEAGTAP